MENKRTAIQNAAYEVFLKKGYKRTGISEITQHAGVAVGSFYKYYDSKEAVFLDIYIYENNRLRNRLMNEINWSDQIELVIEQLYDEVIQEIFENNILAEWNKSNVATYIREYYASDKGKEENTFYHFLVDILTKKLIEQGYTDIEIEELKAVNDLIYYIDCNMKKEEFDNYANTMRTLIKYLVRGIFLKK